VITAAVDWQYRRAMLGPQAFAVHQCIAQKAGCCVTDRQKRDHVRENPLSNPPTPSILVVEDERHIARFLEFVLHKEGYTVESAFDGDEAVQRLQSHTYSAVLLDLGLPGPSGREVLRYLRSWEERDKTVVIALTAKFSGDVLHEVLAAGANAHCSKPVAPSTLLRKLKDLGVANGYCAATGGTNPTILEECRL
jgi:CheY-like chemotaxis protein